MAGRQPYSTAGSSRKVPLKNHVFGRSALHNTRPARPDNRKVQHEQRRHMSDSSGKRHARVKKRANYFLFHFSSVARVVIRLRTISGKK